MKALPSEAEPNAFAMIVTTRFRVVRYANCTA
jgi:hypothetical protein